MIRDLNQNVQAHLQPSHLMQKQKLAAAAAVLCLLVFGCLFLFAAGPQLFVIHIQLTLDRLRNERSLETDSEKTE